jgi:hypothetical protein
MPFNRLREVACQLAWFHRQDQLSVSCTMAISQAVRERH